MDTIDLSGLSLDGMLSREWLLSNGVGGYAASTLPACNTRKYHGLLVAAMSPPVRRMVILSRVEETVYHDGWPHPLACNEYPDAMHPMGHQLLRAFAVDPFPRWAYQGQGWTIEKQLHLLQGENTVLLSYTLLGSAKPIDLQIRPLFALRDFHELMYQWNGALSPENLTPTHHHIRATHSTPEAFFAHDGQFAPEGYWYLNTIYRREQERGYSGLEDLWSPGVASFKLHPGQTVHFACSTDPIDLERVIAQSRRQHTSSQRPASSTNPVLRQLTRAAEQFTVQSRDGKTNLLSGYPWASPSGRDALISLPGALLVPGNFAAARSLLEHFASLAVRGVMPSEFPPDGTAPQYRGADVSLWFINALHEYHRHTADDQTVQKLFDVVDEILTHYANGTTLGIHADADGLLLSAPGATWMNTLVNETQLTPREGRAVEINALWHNALRAAADWARQFHHPLRAEELHMLANKARLAFNRLFWNEQANCCFDVVGDSQNDAAIRPNQLLSISLAFPILNVERHQAVLAKVQEELLTPFGVRTLARADSQYAGRYFGPISSRDRAYHNGCAFPWLLGPFVTAFIRVYGRSDKTRQQALAYIQSCLTHLEQQGCGQIPELFDGDAPHAPGGMTACATSVAEITRAYACEIHDFTYPDRSASPAELPGDVASPI